MKKASFIFVTRIALGILSLFSLAGCSVRPNVTASHMAGQVKFGTYAFSRTPAWTAQPQINDLRFFNKRVFIITCRAEDNRHVVLAQSETYNETLPQKIKDKGRLVYTSPNGFKVWGMPEDREKWFSGVVLKSASHFIGAPPSDDRVGYVLESPVATFPALAINGPISDKELHSIVDSFVPARDVVGNRSKTTGGI